MRTVLYVVLGLAVLLVGAVVALPYVVPQDLLRSTVAGQIERATGREIRLEGEVGLTVLPRPSARLGGVTVAGAPAVEAPPLVRLGELDAQFALVPLLSGNVQVERFVLRGLEVALVVDEQGRANWATAPGPGERTGTAGETGAAPADGGGTGGGVAAPLPAVSLGDVRLVDGAVRYTDRRDGTTRRVENIDGTIAMAALDQPLTLDLAGELDGRAVEFDGRLAALAPLLRGGGTTADLAVAGDGLDVAFAGEIVGGDAPSVAGDLDLAVREAAATLAWLAAQPVELPVSTIELAGALAASPARVSLEDLRLTVDATSGTGRVAVELDRARPLVAGRLDVGEVDLARLGMGAAGDGPAAERTPAGDGDTPAEAPAGADGWSRAPIGYTHPPIDLDLALSVEGIAAPPLRLGAGSVTLAGDAERLLLTLQELAFYGGNVAGTIRLAPAETGMAVAKDVRITNVRTGPLLADLGGTDFLDGRADLDLAIETRGASQYDLVAAADGSGSFAVEQAVLKGLAGRPELEALRALLSLGGEAGAPLRIASAEGTVNLTDGVVRNDDLVAATANLRLTGAGRVDLVNRRVPGYTIRPEAKGALAGLQRLRPLLVPLIIEGPFDRLRVRPDPSAVAAGAVEEVERALEAAGEQARQGNLEDAAETLINRGLGGALESLGIRP